MPRCGACCVSTKAVSSSLTISKCAASQMGCFCAPRGAQFLARLFNAAFELGHGRGHDAARSKRRAGCVRPRILTLGIGARTP